MVPFDPAVAVIVYVEQVGGLLAPFAQPVVVTDMFVHAPQLLVSFDSVMVPVLVAEDLSAHARMEYVPALANVYDLVYTLEFPEAIELIEFEERPVMVPAPFAAVATCMKLENDAPVEAFPVLEMVALKLAAVPTRTVAGSVIALETRSGLGVVTHDPLTGV